VASSGPPARGVAGKARRRTNAIPQFRCEGCAYDLTATPLDAACPECGMRAGDSLPDRRLGVLWQRHPSFSSWFSTLWRATVSPHATAKALRIEPRATHALLVINLTIGTVLIAIPGLLTLALGTKPLVVLRGTVTDMSLDMSLARSIWFVVAFPALILAVIALVARYYAPRRQPAMRPEVVWANQALVSYTYPIIGFLVAIGAIAWQALAPDAPINANETTRIALLKILMASWFYSLILGGVWGTVVDWHATRVNRYANAIKVAKDARNANH
jgi:hypothetical protein